MSSWVERIVSWPCGGTIDKCVGTAFEGNLNIHAHSCWCTSWEMKMQWWTFTHDPLGATPNGTSGWILTWLHFLLTFSAPITGMLECLLHEFRNIYVLDFHLADEAFFVEWVAMHSKNWKTHWEHWASYVQPLDVEPYLQEIRYIKRVCIISGFMAQV